MSTDETAAAPGGNGKSDPSTRQFKLTGPELRDDGSTYFTDEDLNLYELCQYKLRSALQATRLKQNEADEYQRKANQKLAQLQLQKKQLDVEVERHRKKLVELQQAITEKYGVDLSRVTYDDETGRILEPPPYTEVAQPEA